MAKKVEKWEASDGMMFDTMKEAEEYDKRQRVSKALRDVFMGDRDVDRIVSLIMSKLSEVSKALM
jgi:hypothetical protein